MSASIINTQGIVAIAAAAVALTAVLGCAYLALSLRRLRRAQRVVLGDLGQRDLAGHAADLQRAFGELRQYLEDASERMDSRLGQAEVALRRAIAHRGLVRYDAYNEQSGHQSVSVALVDATGSGVVISCIHHRDQARVYFKRVHHGQGELELSPEEAEALRQALETAQAPVPAPSG